MGRLNRRFSEQNLVLAGCFLLGLGFFLLPIRVSLPGLVLSTILLAVGHSIVVVPLNAMASKSLGPQAQGRVLGLMQSSASLGRIVGPVLGGFLLHWEAARSPAQFGRAAFWMGTVLSLIAMGTSLSLRISQEGVPR